MRTAKLSRKESSVQEEIIGQSTAKRALMIAVSGGHNIHLYGPPGTGKSALAKASLNLLPDLSKDEAMIVCQIHSLKKGAFAPSLEPPFRSPHHTSSQVAIIGGGIQAHPGELSLAHGGVLLLDELPEFNLKLIESLRQPLEDKQITIARSGQSTTYPANFILLATSNPCPCGFAGSLSNNCTCSQSELSRYRKRLSGPILDRIDIIVQVESSQHESLLKPNKAQKETLSALRQKVALVRKTQAKRNPKSKLNADLSLKELKAVGRLSSHASALLSKLSTNLQLSSRGLIRTYRVSRTIADLDNKEDIDEQHIAEAAQYRALPTKRFA